MALVATREARDIGLSLVGFREIRKLERAGLRLVIVDQPVLRVRPRRAARRRVRWLALAFVVVALAVLYAVRLSGATFDFLRS